ncbi:hypothetical protein LEP1GSC096_2364 [Leptospira interrogans serovar Hebdomadis str. R499]|nr:hypothetical protein LEP1GSC019_4597 [Leptospira interrogans serovar Pyrogenes str. 2006006960]EKR36138.1 hypothetical protein LEP1GSC096_2364 [Leptospira interrogans serovar Hebdomadis str. R499]EMN97614.1 hypothetical protein LEP1GSC112_1628 [Leptospira interrogans serovar Pomona str. UT364]
MIFGILYFKFFYYIVFYFSKSYTQMKRRFLILKLNLTFLF